MPSPPVLLASGVWRLPTLGRSMVNSFAFEETDGSLTLVDAGVRGATKRLVAQLNTIGKRPEQVRRIVLTHAHFDHVGDARRLRVLHTPGHTPGHCSFVTSRPVS